MAGCCSLFIHKELKYRKTKNMIIQFTLFVFNNFRNENIFEYF